MTAREKRTPRDSPEPLTVSRFVYWAVILRDLEHPDLGTRFKAEKWDGTHTYREWLSLYRAWAETDLLERGQ